MIPISFHIHVPSIILGLFSGFILGTIVWWFSPYRNI